MTWQAVPRALPGVPHQLCQFRFLRKAVTSVFEADRHAKKELKKQQMRSVRPIEREAMAACRPIGPINVLRLEGSTAAFLVQQGQAGNPAMVM